jgi:hypothetical protein
MCAIFDEIVTEYAGTHLALALSIQVTGPNLGALLFQVTSPLIHNIRHSLIDTTWYIFGFLALACLATISVTLLDSKARYKVLSPRSL